MGWVDYPQYKEFDSAIGGETSFFGGNVHPETRKFMIQFDVRIFFKWVGEITPTSIGIWNKPGRFLGDLSRRLVVNSKPLIQVKDLQKVMAQIVTYIYVII